MGKCGLRNRVRLFDPFVRPHEAVRDALHPADRLLHVRDRRDPSYAQSEEAEVEGEEGGRLGRRQAAARAGGDRRREGRYRR